MPRFRKKPVVIEAWEYKGNRFDKGICDCGASPHYHLHTIHGAQVVVPTVGDWIIPEPDGEHFYPCKADIFASTYESVDATPPVTAVPAKWLPIETAPKGVRSLLWRDNDLANVGWFIADWAQYETYNDPKFTHWMPLPPAPGTR